MRESISSLPWRSARIVVVALSLAAVADLAFASRIAGAAQAAASSVLGSAPQPALVQADESASLRQGTVGAVDERGGRVQVQGVWLDLVAGRTVLLRGGRPAGLETLRPGEAIRFTVLSASGAAPVLKVIYAP